jgi:hypothetical protein
VPQCVISSDRAGLQWQLPLAARASQRQRQAVRNITWN